MTLRRNAEVASRSRILHCRTIFLAFFSILLGSISYSEASAPSAKRERGQDWRSVALKRHLIEVNEGRSPIISDTTAYGSAVPYANLDQNRAIEWNVPLSRVVEIFNQFRDLRFYPDPDNNSFLRRSSWLYPDDGCFARAALLAQNFESAHLEVSTPSKVFIFGNLEVKTPNSPYGSVEWWYHVVPAARIGTDIYILDPAIEPKQPLLLVDWVKTMVPDPSNANLSICSSHTYGPSDSCDNGINDGGAYTDQGYYLSAERARLQYMNRNADSELGDAPPWLASSP